MDTNFEYYDISPEISEKIAVWPGDVNFQRKVAVDFQDGGNLRLSSIHTTVHLGAHTDAPNHYHQDGKGIDTRSLDFYLGDCQVITVKSARSHRIKPADLGNKKILAKRVLFKTQSFPNPNQWNSDFNALSPELIHYLAKQGVVLTGLDTPSIDLFDDQELCTHQAVYENNMAVLEGIILESVPDGVYTLVALPLKIQDADASPVRAILIKNRES